jgi:purine-binding chemotaxis protein CheW
MEKQFMTFSIDDGVYGINILGIREINYSRKFTPVPLAKSHIKGLLNLRGQIVTIWDMGIPLGYPERAISENTSLLVMKTLEDLSNVARKAGIHTHKDQVGLLVDQIGDVISCQESDIQPVPAHADSQVAKFLEGVIQQDDTLVGLINILELLKFE